MLAHGAVLRSEIFTDEQLEAIARDFRSAGLSPAEVAAMEYAEKIALNAYKVTPEDIDHLHQHGLSDEQILHVALTAAARCFFSKLLDAVGAEPDQEYAQIPPGLQDALAKGRPFSPLPA
jgi:alkylhydroperoxidase family enzyme